MSKINKNLHNSNNKHHMNENRRFFDKEKITPEPSTKINTLFSNYLGQNATEDTQRHPAYNNRYKLEEFDPDSSIRLSMTESLNHSKFESNEVTEEVFNTQRNDNTFHEFERKGTKIVNFKHMVKDKSKERNEHSPPIWDCTDDETDICEKKEACININIVSRSICKERLAFQNINKLN